MKIKTYPLQFTEERLKEIADKAKSEGKTIKDFMHKAIEEAMKK